MACESPQNYTVPHPLVSVAIARIWIAVMDLPKSEGVRKAENEVGTSSKVEEAV